MDKYKHLIDKPEYKITGLKIGRNRPIVRSRMFRAILCAFVPFGSLRRKFQAYLAGRQSTVELKKIHK
jgi:hypothetical protein